MFDNVLASVIAGILMGLCGYFFRDLRNWNRFKRIFGRNLSEFSGDWYGYHITRRDGTNILSTHEYKLKAHGAKIDGTYMEMAAEKPYSFDVKGDGSGPHILLVSQSDYTFETSVALIHNTTQRETLFGLYLAHDFDKHPFCCPLVMSRKELTEAEALALIKKAGGSYLDEL